MKCKYMTNFVILVLSFLNTFIISIYLTTYSSYKKNIEGPKILIFFITVVMIHNMGFLFKIVSFDFGFSLVLVQLGYLSIVIVGSILYFRLFNIVRVAREKAVDSFVDYLIIIDHNRKILDINKSGIESNIIGYLNIGDHISYDSHIEKFINNTLDDFNKYTEATSFKYSDKDRHFQIKISSINYKNRSDFGYSIVFHDATESVNLMIKLEEQARTDYLTGISNRRYWISLVERKLQISNSKDTSFVLMILDIDCFKNINDTYGHLTGDKLLVEFANIIKNLIRENDVLGRYGGEEFCLFCSNTDVITGNFLAEKIRRSVEKHVFIYDDISIKVTVSIGCYHDLKGQWDMTNEYLNSADMLLYEAKESGRNKVISTGMKSKK